MTDAQLSILLYQHWARLRSLIDDVEAALPDDLKVDKRAWIGPPWGRGEYRESAILDDLRAFAHELKQDSELLELTAKDNHNTQAGR